MKSSAVSFLKIAKSERGNVESALVIIPLLILFLLGMQLSIYVHSRNTEKLLAQDDANTRAISGESSLGDEFLHIESSGEGRGLNLLITHRRSQVRDVLPGALGLSVKSRGIEVSGIAVVETYP